MGRSCVYSDGLYKGKAILIHVGKLGHEGFTIQCKDIKIGKPFNPNFDPDWDDEDDSCDIFVSIQESEFVANKELDYPFESRLDIHFDNADDDYDRIDKQRADEQQYLKDMHKRAKALIGQEVTLLGIVTDSLEFSDFENYRNVEIGNIIQEK